MNLIYLTKMNKETIKTKLIDIISQYGDGPCEFETKDVTEMINWIDELQKELAKYNHSFTVEGGTQPMPPQITTTPIKNINKIQKKNAVRRKYN